MSARDAVSPRRADDDAGDVAGDDASDGAGGDAGDVGADAAEDFVRRHPGIVSFARIGWATKGLVYVLTGILAFTVATDAHGTSAGPDGQAAPSGAVATIARQSYGSFLLWMIAAGLLVYASWRIVTVLLPADFGSRAVLRRIGYGASAATYVVLGFTAASLALHPGSSGSSGESQDSRISSITRSVMEWPTGRWLVGVVGLVVIGIAVHFAWKAATASFERELENRSIGPVPWTIVREMGRIGWLGRAAMMALIGVFVSRAAIRFDPDEARGLDDSLRRVADDTGGVVLVVVVAFGLLSYGAFCIVSSPVRRLVASDEDSVAS